MRLKLFTFLILCFLLFLLLHLKQPPKYQEEGWYPFVISEHLDPNSPANMGKLLLDPPAGKHGFCKVKNGHFYFEDGTRAKFWGTNLCFNASFPTKEQAELIADRIAFFGFNAVRLHHMDFYFEPRGIFEDICPDCKDPQMKKTTKLSEKQLDRLDYLIYLLKQRGIYIDINLLVARHFTLADGVKDADKLSKAAKPVSMFDPKLIELQKQYAKDLLMHYNPYTKLRYCDDPVIALVEITNENSIFDLKTKKLPYYYQKLLDDGWEKWKAQNKIKDNNKDAYFIELEKKYFDQMRNFIKGEAGVRVPITGIGGYTTSKDIQAQDSCDYLDSHTYWDHPHFSGSGWDKNNFTIRNNSVLMDRKLGNIGKLDKRTQTPRSQPYTVSEWNHCYPNDFAYETPPFIASIAKRNNLDGLFNFAFSHGWEKQPAFDRINNYFDTIANSQKLITCGLGSLIFINNNILDFSVENGILKIAGDKIIGASGFIKRVPLLFSAAELTTDQNGAVFLVSLSEKPVIKSTTLLLIVVSEIKNSGSGWVKNKYLWGKQPVYLKEIEVKVKLKRTGRAKVFSLNSRGKREKKIPITLRNDSLLFSTHNINSPWFEIIFE